jgi:hypothetical protein
VTGFAPHLIIDAFTIFVIAIHKESPASLARAQELLMIFCVDFFLGSFLDELRFNTFGTFPRFCAKFRVANWFHILQPKTRSPEKVNTDVCLETSEHKAIQ